jgi:hypothetical protein
VGVCECHFPYKGDDCSKCEKNYIFNHTSKECMKQRKCTNNGGTEDCNGHGICTEDEITGQAICECD